MPFLLNTFSIHWFGFFPKRSATQLLLVLKTIHKAIYASIAVDILYLDFRKAFDTVSHENLMDKLWSIVIRGNLWQWFKAYLSNRYGRYALNLIVNFYTLIYQCVKIDNNFPNNNFPSILSLVSGVRQGSILGPLLFALSINDLPNYASSSISYLFTDDTKCLKVISTQQTSKFCKKTLII